jgi:hypothetical protein
MVLAIAALIFQAAATSPAILSEPSPPPPSESATSGEASLVPTRANTSTTPLLSADLLLVSEPLPLTNSDHPKAVTGAEPDDTSVIHARLDSLKLESSNSKGNSSNSITSVSMDAGQNSSAFSTIRIPDPKASKQIEIIQAEGYPTRRAWIALSVVQHGAAFLDAYSTRQAVSSGAVEADPMMRPFAGSPAIYGAIQAGPVLLDFFARRLQRSESPFVRRMWWLPQTMSTGAFLISGVHNLGVAHRMH